MNAPAKITASEVREPPAWHRYIPAARTMCPGEPEAQTRQRAGLMLLRDLAGSALRRASPEACVVLQAVEHLASRHALSGMTTERLTAARLALVRMMTAARDLEKVFADGGR